MLDAARPDAVSVCVPTRKHFEVASACIERGIATLVEKPLAATLDEGERLRDIAAEEASRSQSAISSASTPP